MATKTFAAALAFLAAGILLPPAHLLKADPVIWTLRNPLTFGLGGILTGSFQYDASTNTYSNINLSMTPDLDLAWGPANVRSAWSGVPSTASRLVFGIMESGPDDVFLNFANPLTNAGGTNTIGSGIVLDAREIIAPWLGNAGDDGGTTNTASIEGTPTPEPAYWLTLLLGLAALAAIRIRKHRPAVTGSAQ